MKRRGASGSRDSSRARRAPSLPARVGSEAVVPTIQILVAEDKAMDRAGFVAILRSQPDFEVVGEASTTDDVVRACRDRKPSLIVVSVTLPAPVGMTPIAGIHAHEPRIPILAVAQRSEIDCMVLNPPLIACAATNGRDEQCSAGNDCLELAVAEGASGTIRRTAAPEDLYDAIRTLAAGKPWYDPGTAAAIMRHALARHENEGDRKPLSKRETEVSGLIAAGRSNKEIARTLGIAEPTVKKHVGHILAKLNLQDRLQVGIHLTRNPLLLRVSAARRS